MAHVEHAEGHGTPDPHAAGHPGPMLYLKIGVVLFILTALEVGLYELAHRGGSLEAILKPMLVPLLLILSAGKFALVAMYYMHLKFEPPRLVVMVMAPIPLAILITATVVMMEIR
jgi:cytochrome c oxidase subunit 4